MSYKSAPQEWPTRVSVPQEWVSHKSVPQECPTRVSHKSDPQKCPTRVTHKSFPQECPTRVSHKSVPEECPTRVSYKSVPEECPTRVSNKSVIWTYVAFRTCLHSGSWAPFFSGKTRVPENALPRTNIAAQPETLIAFQSVQILMPNGFEQGACSFKTDTEARLRSALLLVPCDTFTDLDIQPVVLDSDR